MARNEVYTLPIWYRLAGKWDFAADDLERPVFADQVFAVGETSLGVATC